MGSKTTKRAVLIGTALILYILWLALGTLSEYYPIKNYPPAQYGSILLFGDSLATTSGVGFTNILEKRLDISIMTRIIATGTLHSNTEYVAREIVQQKPRIVIFCFSDNNEVGNLAQAQYQGDLRTVIADAQQSGAVTLLLGASRIHPNAQQEDILMQLARETHSIIVPNILLFVENNQHYWDNNALNAGGNLRVADMIAPTLEGLTFNTVKQPQ